MRGKIQNTLPISFYYSFTSIVLLSLPSLLYPQFTKTLVNIIHHLLFEWKLLSILYSFISVFYNLFAVITHNNSEGKLRSKKVQ